MTRINTARRSAERGAFTLIELLVVIAIISILAALTMAAVQKVRARGQDVQARSDIQQLEAACTAFKAKFGVFPPSAGGGAGGTFRLRQNYSTGFTANDPEVVILKQIFPRLNMTNNGLNTASIDLDPNQCLAFFLSGGAFTNYSGFSTNPLTPFTAPVATDPSSSRLYGGPFFEGFTTSRMGLPSKNGGTSNDAQPWFLDPWSTPYLYISTDKGNDYPFDSTYKHPVAAVQTLLTAAMTRAPWTGFRPARDTGASSRYFNVKSFQIFSAGRNKIFGTGGAYTSGSGVYALNKDGGDDWSNYQQTPLGVTD